MSVIYFYNWWGGFFDGNDANNISFFKTLFDHTVFKNFKIATTNNTQSSIIFVNDTPNLAPLQLSKYKCAINFIGEPRNPEYDKFDLIITGAKNSPNILYLPLSVMYIMGNNLYPKLFSRTIKTIPPKFCCFVVTNPKCPARNAMFQYLCKYKKVDSCGKFANNTGIDVVYMNWWSDEYIKFISQYKFMICFENTFMQAYSTEKIVNAYLGNTIPIYWGTSDVFNIFNKDSMIYLEGTSESDFLRVVSKVAELDNNDTAYLEYANRPIINKYNVEYWNNHFTYEILGNKINEILSDKMSTILHTCL